MSTPIIDRLNAAFGDRYRVEAEVGAGGMATVYRARDLRHERDVAVKVLKPDLAAVVGAERFLGEIGITAQLQHPHLLPLFDSGQAEGFLYFVMPYIDGETLRARLEREHELPVEDAVALAQQVAGALAVAHEQGVIHRDIKPANILLSRGGPMVADFGISLAREVEGQRLTETGISVGTPYYMSPEQATGDRPVGPATDVYSLACVLYEMLTGSPPYVGSSSHAVLAQIVEGDAPAVSSVRKSVPPNVDAAIRKGLEKLPADRFAGAWDFAAALSDPSFRYGPESAEVGVSARWKRVAIGSAAVAALAMGFALSTIQPEGPPPPVIRYTTTLAQLSPTGSTGEFGISLALSPSGSSLVYVGDFEADHQLFMRARDELESTPISGTEGAYQPFFSPDGGQLGFLQQATRELKVMSLGGERPVTLLDSGVFRLGASWGADGYVYFSQMPHGGIGRVPETGGEIETISTPGDSEPDYVRHSWPDVLPSGRGVLITIQRAPNALGDEDDVAVVDVETGEVTVLFKGVLGRYSTSGHLLFVTHDGELAAAPFDQDRLEVTGSVVTLHSGVPVQRGPDVALSRSGRLVHATIQTSAVQELVWIDRTGAISQADPGSTFDPAEESGPALSPDGSSVALAVRTPQGHTEVWVKQLGGPLNRLLHGGMTSRPRWWLDDESILFVTNIGGAPDLYRQRADGSGDVALVLDLDVPLYDAVFSNREDWLVVRTGPAPESPTSDILAVPIGRDGEPVSLVARDDVQETSPALSADGRYLAYVSNELGYTQVYVRPFPNVDDARFPVGRGREPVWSPSGGELFYKNPSHELVAVSLGAGPDFEILEQTPLFELPPDALYYYGRATYDVDRAGQRFLMLRATGEAAEAQGHLVVENVHELLRSGDGG